MKKNSRLLYGIGLIAALCIGFFIGTMVDFPKADKSELAGTFGKAEKYRKPQMTAKDIQLRSDLVKDTAQLRSMIQGLAYFSVFTEEVCSNIELSVIAFKAQGMGDQAGEADKIKALQDYSDFIRNNNKALNSTIAMLTGFYGNDTASLSQDVEKNLRDFGTYLNNLNEKNQVLTDALTGMDEFMLSNKTLQAHKAEITQLKSIRDQMLIKGIQLAGIMGDKKQAGSMMSYAYSSQQRLDGVFEAKENLGAIILGKEKLDSHQLDKEKLDGILLSKENLGIIIMGKETLGSGAGNGSGLSFIYDKPNLQFIAANESQLGLIVLASANLNLYNYQPLCLFGNQGLNIILSNYSLQAVIQSQLGSSLLSNNTLNRILAHDNLQKILLSTEGLKGMMNLAAMNGLGVIEQ